MAVRRSGGRRESCVADLREGASVARLLDAHETGVQAITTTVGIGSSWCVSPAMSRR